MSSGLNNEMVQNLVEPVCSQSMGALNILCFLIIAVAPLVAGCSGEGAVSERKLTEVDRSSPVEQGTFGVSHEGLRAAYVTQRGDGWHVVINNEISRGYDAVAADSIVFGPSGRHVAFVAGEGEQWFVVLDGKRQPSFDAVTAGSPRFSSDGNRFAYVGRSGEQYSVVADGTPGRAYDRIDEMLFSPDGTRLAYVALKDGEAFVVEEGTEKQHYDNNGMLAFSPDSATLAYIAREGKEEFVVVEDVPGPSYDYIIRSGIVFDSPSRLHYVALRGNEVLRIDQDVD